MATNPFAASRDTGGGGGGTPTTSSSLLRYLQGVAQSSGRTITDPNQPGYHNRAYGAGIGDVTEGGARGVDSVGGAQPGGDKLQASGPFAQSGARANELSSGGGAPPPAGGAPAPTAAGTPGGAAGGSQAATAFGQLFTPAAYGEAWADPDAVINQWFNYKGLPTDSGALAMNSQLANSLGILWMLARGDEATKGTSDYLDYVGQFLGNANTPGGSIMGPQEVMQSLLTDDPNSIIYNNLYGEDMTGAQQVDALLSAMRWGMAPTLPAPILDAVLSRAAAVGNDFKSAQLTGQTDTGTYGQYLQSKGVPGMFGIGG
ncbi:MAG TPA: hypothetical protein VFU21_07870 [Kofleriaceae bacterium]|nr:hypothetical protein [Kofleriaceae bacterium]